MDEIDFSEDTTCKQQEDLPYDGDLSQMKIYDCYNFASENYNLDVTGQVVLTGEHPQEKAIHETCGNIVMDITRDERIENAVNKTCDKEKQNTMTCHVPANKGDTPKSNISDILLRHLSKEKFLKDQGIDGETFPETSEADNVDETAILKKIISRYLRNSWSKEQTPEFTDQPSPQRVDEDSNKASSSLRTTEENTSYLKGSEASSESRREENSNFLNRIKGPSDKQINCLGQTPQKQLTEEATSSNGFKYGQGQIHYQLPDFSKVAPKVKIPQNNINNKPLTIANQASFSPKLRYQSMIVQGILETMSRSNYAEKQPEQKRNITEPLQQMQSKPTIHTHQELLTGLESEKRCLKVIPTFQKDCSIFQKISQGKQMCQQLKEQTDQLETKVKEFSKRMKQDSLCHLEDRRMVLEQLQEHLEALEQQILKHESAAADDIDPERKQNMENKEHRWTSCRKFSVVIHKKARHKDSTLSSNKGPSFCSGSGNGLQSNKYEDCGTKIHNCQRACSKEPLKEFHYRYNTPKQNYLNHGGRSAFRQTRSFHENKKSPASCSKPKWICSQTVNSKLFPDECDSTAGKKSPKSFMNDSPELATPSAHFHFCKISGNESLCDCTSAGQMESKILNSVLDHALKTATVLRKTTDQMIQAISEDLAKAQSWRHRLNY